MKLGVALPVAGAWATADNLIHIAQRAEALGYHSLLGLSAATLCAGP